MWGGLLVLLVLLVVNVCGVDTDITSLVTEQGFPVEFHEVWTEDKFQLGTYRIPRAGAKPVLFSHGFLNNGGTWVVNELDNGLAFMVADAGYDVWLISYRGSVYSEYNSDMDRSSKDYWDFSFTEFGFFDLPVVVDYVLNTTGFNNLSIIAHSEGAAATFVMLSSFHEYNDKVNLFMPLAPAVFISDMTSWPFVIADFLKVFNIMYDLHIWYVNADDTIGDLLGETICSWLGEICDVVLATIVGWDLSNADPDRIPIYLEGGGDVSSTKNLLHGMQCMDSNKFRQWDYGSEKKNKDAYGQVTPPEFPLETVTSPIALYYGGQDELVVPKDVENYLIPSLSPETLVVEPTLIEEFNHLDMTWAKDGSWYRQMASVLTKLVGDPKGEYPITKI